eukprot:scaffold18750_cov113-Isochrysis_galbana.AAC.8
MSHPAEPSHAPPPWPSSPLDASIASAARAIPVVDSDRTIRTSGTTCSAYTGSTSAAPESLPL